jgi:RNA polymerase sigma factor (sigma-70 family)
MLTGPADADDLVSDAFVKVLNVLLGGGGPDVAFRAYLLTAVRRLHVDRYRSTQRTNPVDDLTPYDPGVPFTDTAVAGFEGGAAARAFASLPERWQMVLWHLEVENQKPADIAPLLGMSANSVSALAYRAREGLRQAFLTMHAGDLADEHCRETNDLLGGYVRGALSKRDSAKVNDHLVHCRRCTAVYLELADVNSSLAAVLGPALLGTAAAAYAATGAGGAAGGLGLVALLDRAKDFVAANAVATTAGAAAVGVAATTVVLVATHHSNPDRPSAAADAPGASTPSAQAPRHPGRARHPATSPRSQSPAKHGLSAQAPASHAPASSGVGVVSPPGASTDTGAQDPAQTAPRQDHPSATQAGHPGSTQPDNPPSSHPPSSDPPPKSDPSPNSPPPDSPPPPKNPPPAHTLDLHVTTQPAAPVDGRVTVTVLALGLTNGLQGTLVATANTGSFQQVGGPACARLPHGFTCPVTGPAVLFRFSNTAASGPTMTFRVTPPSGYDDPNPGNNSATVRVPRH